MSVYPFRAYCVPTDILSQPFTPKPAFRTVLFCNTSNARVAEAGTGIRCPASNRRAQLQCIQGNGPELRYFGMLASRLKVILDNTVEGLKNTARLRWSEQDHRGIRCRFRETGFRGGLNCIRNHHSFMGTTAPWREQLIHQPSLFMPGEELMTYSSFLVSS